MKNKIVLIVCVIAVTLTGVLIALSVINIQRISKTDNSEMPKDSTVALTSLSFNSSTIDLGTVYGDTLVSSTFILKNTGNAPLIIHNVNPECTCTSFSVSKYKVMPQDTASIILNLNTSGRIHSQVINTVVTANTEVPKHLLRMKVNIER